MSSINFLQHQMEYIMYIGDKTTTRAGAQFHLGREPQSFHPCKRLPTTLNDNVRYPETLVINRNPSINRYQQGVDEGADHRISSSLLKFPNHNDLTYPY